MLKNQLWILSSFLILFPALTFSQAAHRKEEIHQVPVSPGDTSAWVNTYRNIYSYNANGLSIQTASQSWAKEIQSWRISNLINTAYDKHNRKVREEEIYFKNYPVDTSSDYLMTWTYDNGMLVKDNYSGWKKTSGYIKSKFSFNVTGLYSNNCLISEVSYYKSENYSDPSDMTETWDSMACSYITPCLISESAYYTRNYKSETYHLTSHYKYEYEFNPAGLITKKDYYSLSSDSSVLKLYSSDLIAYDSNGNDTSQLKINYSSGLVLSTSNIFDDEGRIIKQITVSYDSLNSKWINYNMSEYEYDDSGKLLRSSEKDNWNTLLNSYCRTSYLINRYNITGFLEYTRSDFYEIQGNSPSDTTLNHAASENLYFNRCDGNNSISVFHLIENNIETINFFRPELEKTIYSYYEIASCESIEDASEEITIFPNPARAYINIYSEDIIGHGQLVITGLKGRQLIKKEMEMPNYFSIDVNGLNSGMYILNIMTDRTNFTRKFIVSD